MNQWQRRLTHGATMIAVFVCANAFGAPAFADTLKVAIDKMTFVPSTITAHVGDTITFENKDNLPHTITAPGTWDEKIAARTSITVTLKSEGKIEYHCSIHPFMKGQIVIEPAVAAHVR